MDTMPLTIMKHINEVVENDLLATDIYHNDKLILMKNTKLTERIISLLKKRNIKEVGIMLENDHEENIVEQTIQEQSYEIKKTFFKDFENVGSEARYGGLLTTSEEMEFITDLFVKFHIEYDFIDKLYKLKDWDPYSYIHSFDVFILGTLLARKSGITDLESVALGYLLHDIGKLCIPRELLTNEGKLNYEEFSIIKTHTTEGDIILKSLSLGHIAHFAKSHHERIDGSGYPENLKGVDFGTELKILQIVDVYSALTLKRPYKEALSAAEALKILYRDAHKYDSELLSYFIESLKIYPTNSTVLLSDNTFAKVEKVNGLVPMLPMVKRINETASFTLPNDFKLTITRMIKYHSKSFEEVLNDFFKNMILGNDEIVLKKYYELLDGLKLEEIYTKVLIPMYRVLVILHKENKMEEEKFNKRILLLMWLLELVEETIIKRNKYDNTTLLIIEGRHASAITLKILQGLLRIESIYPVVNKSLVTPEKVKSLVTRYSADSVCYLNASNEDHSEKTVISNEIKFKSVSITKLTSLIESLTSLSNESIRIYDRLFEVNSFMVERKASIR